MRESAIVDLDLAQDGDDRHEQTRAAGSARSTSSCRPGSTAYAASADRQSGIARAVVPGEAGVGDPAGPFGSTGHAVDRVMLEV